ncbi:MAG: response regulator transcription factor [Fibrobacteres bacterium]|nr:response regulator transcription factor [Fibrobacterota bacterium]
MAIIETPFVLSIHENRSIRSLIPSILKHAGYGALAVASENEAVRLLRAGYSGIRLLIMEQCGTASRPVLLEAAGGQYGAMKVLYLTPFRSLAERVADALKHPESGFLAKPFSPKALLNLVDALIGPPERSRQESWSLAREFRA